VAAKRQALGFKVGSFLLSGSSIRALQVKYRLYLFAFRLK